MGKRWVRLLALAIPALTGCLSHTRKLQQPKQAGVALTAGVAQLVDDVNQRYEHVQSLNATVEFSTTVGGAHKGKQTDYTSIRGFILFRKPQMLRVLGLVPVLHTRLFDLASNGSTFKLLIPPRNRAIEGSNTVTTPAANSMENLRPDVFLESMLVHSIDANQIVYLTSESSTRRDPKTKDLIEEPDYDLAILTEGSKPQSVPVEVVKALRVIRFSRINLLPTEQDIYNTNGDVETQVLYDQYQNFNGFQFPHTITIKRPLEEYQISLAIEKLTVNQPLSDEQFQLKLPEGTQVETLK